MLPLAGGTIDRLIVERVAIDTLGGLFKDRQQISDKKAGPLYWYGPQYRFNSRLEMLKEEFDGRCAYCGQAANLVDVEHILPHSAFPFDSYLNVVPACDDCNRRKGARTPLQAGMTINENAFDAYVNYVRRQKPPHRLHEIKKGMLKLLLRPGQDGQPERMLGMIANNLVQVTNTQRGPRPLARYLASKLETATGNRPAIAFVSGRHTALYRRVVLPEYDKPAEKESGDVRNHAVDAILLGCQFPSAAALENQTWYRTTADVVTWCNKVRAVSPPLDDGVPEVARHDLVPFFETDLGGGYIGIDLSAFNWNHGRRGTHDLDPFAITRSGKPAKRVPAAKVLAELLLDAGRRDKQIAGIANRGLRNLLEAAPQNAPMAFVTWLQQTTRDGLADGTMGNHPADQARRQQLEKFVAATVENVIADDEPIPAVVGVRCISNISAGLVEVPRCDRSGRVHQHYKANPPVREFYVGYRSKDGAIDGSRPIVFSVNQVYLVRREEGGKKVGLDLPPGSPLLGRPLGAQGRLRDFLVAWRSAFDELCRAEGISRRFRVTQGCVIEKVDGSLFQLRNFDKSEPWRKAASFRNIHRIHRSPLTATDP